MSKRKLSGASPVKEKQSRHGKPILSPPVCLSSSRLMERNECPLCANARQLQAHWNPLSFSLLIRIDWPRKTLKEWCHCFSLFYWGISSSPVLNFTVGNYGFGNLYQSRKDSNLFFPEQRFLFGTLEVGSKIPYFTKEDGTSCQRKSMGRGKLLRTHISK